MWDANVDDADVPLLTLQHGGSLNGAAWNRDESRILTWSSDGTARLWDAGGQLTGAVMQHEKAVLGGALECRQPAYSDVVG